MKKYVKWIVLGVVVLIVVVVGIVLLSLDSIVRSTVESQATDSLDLKTTLGGANVSLLGGNVKLSDLKVASPAGFQAPEMFTLGGIDVGVGLSQLRSDPIGINTITIDAPMLVIEQSNLKLNFQALMDRKSKVPADAGKPDDGKRDAGEPMRLIIHNLAVNNAAVVLRPGIPGLGNEINVKIPSFELKEIGNSENNKNGAAIKEVVMLMVTTLVQKASESDAVPPEVRQLLSLNVDQLKAQLQTEVTKQIDKVTGELGKNLPGSLGTDAGKQVEKGLGDLLGGKKGKDKPKK